MTVSTSSARLAMFSAAALACVAATVAITGCKRDKPNANRDIQKNQSQFMDEMDDIAKQLEAEEKAKQKQVKEKDAKGKNGDGTPAPRPEATPTTPPPAPADPPGDPGKPSEPKPDPGG